MSFLKILPAFEQITGSRPSASVILEKDYAFAHEAGVFHEETRSLFITSNRLTHLSGVQYVEITRVVFSEKHDKVSQYIINCESIRMGNGGINIGDDILFCDQGSMTSPSALHVMRPYPPFDTRPILTSFNGIPFNSLNDVVVHTDGCIWFTDPAYGYEQGYRPEPRLPSQMYRFDPESGGVRVVADGFGHPNGLCFSPDERILYVTDTDQVHGSGVIRLSKPATIYAFDVQYISRQPFLINRRLFAMSDNGIPDGIKTDRDGNVYSGCGDGIQVWSPGGELIGKILIDGGVANFCFGRAGRLFAMNEKRLWLIQLSPCTEGNILTQAWSIQL